MNRAFSADELEVPGTLGRCPKLPMLARFQRGADIAPEPSIPAARRITARNPAAIVFEIKSFQQTAAGQSRAEKTRVLLTVRGAGWSGSAVTLLFNYSGKLGVGGRKLTITSSPSE